MNQFNYSLIDFYNVVVDRTDISTLLFCDTSLFKSNSCCVGSIKTNCRTSFSDFFLWRVLVFLWSRNLCFYNSAESRKRQFKCRPWAQCASLIAYTAPTLYVRAMEHLTQGLLFQIHLNCMWCSQKFRSFECHFDSSVTCADSGWPRRWSEKQTGCYLEGKATVASFCTSIRPHSFGFQ